MRRSRGGGQVGDEVEHHSSAMAHGSRQAARGGQAATAGQRGRGRGRRLSYSPFADVDVSVDGKPGWFWPRGAMCPVCRVEGCLIRRFHRLRLEFRSWVEFRGYYELLPWRNYFHSELISL